MKLSEMFTFFASKTAKKFENRFRKNTAFMPLKAQERAFL